MGNLVEQLADTPVHAVRLFRVANFLWRRGHRSLPTLITALNRVVFGMHIGAGATIGPGLYVFHGQGLVISSRAVLGSDCRLLHGVTIGERRLGDRSAPTLGDRVTVYAGAVITGGVSIGDDAVIGANAFVTRDVPAGATVLAPQASRVR